MGTTRTIVVALCPVTFIFFMACSGKKNSPTPTPAAVTADTGSKDPVCAADHLQMALDSCADKIMPVLLAAQGKISPAVLIALMSQSSPRPPLPPRGFSPNGPGPGAPGAPGSAGRPNDCPEPPLPKENCKDDLITALVMVKAALDSNKQPAINTSLVYQLYIYGLVQKFIETQAERLNLSLAQKVQLGEDLMNTFSSVVLPGVGLSGAQNSLLSSYMSGTGATTLGTSYGSGATLTGTGTGTGTGAAGGGTLRFAAPSLGASTGVRSNGTGPSRRIAFSPDEGNPEVVGPRFLREARGSGLQLSRSSPNTTPPTVQPTSR